MSYRKSLGLALVMFLAACGQEVHPPMVGDQAPAFSLNRLGGQPLHFPEDFKDKIVAIQFWADWCPPCLSEMTNLAPIYAQYRKQGLVILAINLRQSRPAVAKLVAELNLPYDIALDSTGKVAEQYAVQALPTSFIVDRKGIIRARFLGEATAQAFEQSIVSSGVGLAN